MIKLNVSDIQRFSVGDGDGIRTTVFMKGCNLHCPWCHNPETISSAAQTLYYKDLKQAKTYGYFLSPREVFDVVIADYDFYLESNGGVTVSGGEPLLQAEGVAELCKLLKEAGVSVIIDTAGSVGYSEFEKVNNFVDEYYFDFKAANGGDYNEIIGGKIELIKSNLKNLISVGKRVRVRIPLIEGFNTSHEYSEKMCGILREVGVENIDLLPFHRLGSSKYTALNMYYAYHNIPSMTKERALVISNTYKKYFTDIKIEI